MKAQEFGQDVENQRIRLSDLGKSALIQFLHFALAVFTASASTREFFSPLGIAFCSGTKREYTLFSCFGAMLGYIITNDYLAAFRYVMALIMVYILKVYVNNFSSLKENNIAPALISLFATASTGVVVTVTSAFDLQQIFLRISESTTSFGAAYFFTMGFNTFFKVKDNKSINGRELTSLSIAVIMLLLSFSKLNFAGISPADIICSYLIMVSAYVFNETGGAIIGTGVSLGFAMTGNSSPQVFCYSASGLFSGLFSYSGRVLCAMAYVFSYSAMFLFFEGEAENIINLVETAIASVGFVLTPQKIMYQAKLRLSVSSNSGDGTAVRNMVASRLKMARDAVCDMSGTVGKVSEILKEKAIPDTTGVYLRVRDSVCSDCASFNKCWSEDVSGTISEFDLMIEEIRKTGSVTASFVPPSLQGRCIRIMSLCDSFNKNYSSYSARLGAEGRINEMRKITADQFDTVCEMLDDLLLDFESGTKPLAQKSTALKNSLDDIGAHAFVNCYEDDSLNTIISLTLRADCRTGEKEIVECIEKVTEKEFSPPAIIKNEKEKTMLFWEKTDFSAECVYYQLSSNDNEICGDCFDSFFDGKGNFVAVLSDGMGTGSRAAIDGIMTSSLLSKLIISGFSFPCALRLVNSAMLVKSRDESLATLDILKLNLHTGESVIYKAGATVSLLCRKGKVSEIKKSAMPIGILRKAEFGTVRGRLKDGDLIIMMSDGAADNSIDEIKAYIEENDFSYDLPQKLCAIAKGRNISRPDDITVAVIKVKLNEE